jgi:uncharacterized phiE125 gp8 family phage protein
MAAPSGIAAAVGLGEVQAYARIESGEEEALLAGLVRTATAYCEAFTGLALMSREFEEVVAASAAWVRLETTPVRSIDRADSLCGQAPCAALAAGDWEMDIDSDGHGWVRTHVPVRRLRVSGRAGLADDPNGIPEPLRQGIARLATHLFENRDGTDGEPPAAVTALWRPYRRLRLA